MLTSGLQSRCEKPNLLPSDYRADIDGLRAVAVICVVLFHAGVQPFTGGFVGVDVFFVISGFLITRILTDELSRTGHVSFSTFYVRRARRILPALFFTIALSCVFAFLLFSPEALERFGGSALFAVLSISNVFFWQEAGYFDTEAITKPLLHTWSLGVEEQFYAVWPMLLVGLFGLGVGRSSSESLWPASSACGSTAGSSAAMQSRRPSRLFRGPRTGSARRRQPFSSLRHSGCSSLRSGPPWCGPSVSARSGYPLIPSSSLVSA